MMSVRGDQMRVLRTIFIQQDGSYGCGFGVLARTELPVGRRASEQIGYDRASAAVNKLVAAGLVRITSFLGMEEFHITDEGAAIARRMRTH